MKELQFLHPNANGISGRPGELPIANWSRKVLRKPSLGSKKVGHQKVKCGPEFMNTILNRCPSQYQLMISSDASRRSCRSYKKNSSTRNA